MREISWLAANQLASQEGLSTMEWVSKYKVNTENKLEDEQVYAVPKLIVNELSGFYVTRNSSCIFAASCHWNISWKNTTQSTFVGMTYFNICFRTTALMHQLQGKRATAKYDAKSKGKFISEDVE